MADIKREEKSLHNLQRCKRNTVKEKKLETVKTTKLYKGNWVGGGGGTEEKPSHSI